MTQVTVTPESALLGGADRIVVSPAHGKVRLSTPSSFTAEGEVVRRGDALATIEADAGAVDVASPCDAWVMSYLVTEGQRVEPGTAIAHLRAL